MVLVCSKERQFKNNTKHDNVTRSEDDRNDSDELESDSSEDTNSTSADKKKKRKKLEKYGCPYEMTALSTKTIDRL